MDELKEKAGLAGKIAGGVVLLILLLVAISQSFYTVKESEAAVVTTFGKAEVKEEKGLHFKIPFIQKVEKVDWEINILLQLQCRFQSTRNQDSRPKN